MLGLALALQTKIKEVKIKHSIQGMKTFKEKGLSAYPATVLRGGSWVAVDSPDDEGGAT